MQYWKATSYSNTITPLEVVSETVKYVMYLEGGRVMRTAKESATHVYGRSREEAVRWKQALMEDRVKDLKKSLDSAQSELRQFEEIEGLK